MTEDRKTPEVRYILGRGTQFWQWQFFFFEIKLFHQLLLGNPFAGKELGEPLD
jgi:hypothetical protein